GVFANRILRVGELLIVVEEIFSAQASDRRGMRFDAQTPQRDVDIMYAVVADVAAAEVVPPAPDAMQQVRAIGRLRRRAEPQIEIELRRRLAGRRLADRVAALAVPGLGDQHVADFAAEHPIDPLAHALGAAALRADLQQLAAALDGFGHQPPFANVVTAGLFDVDVLARVEGQNGRR